MPTTTKKTEEEISSLAAVFAKINKEFGAGTIVRGDQITSLHRPRITSGALPLDVALGGGWVVNSWHEIIGLESSGKTALVLKTIAANQTLDRSWKVFWVASEDFNLQWAEQAGCDLKRFTFMFDNGMKTVYSAIIEVLASREYDCVVIDSFPALVPEEEEDAEMSEWQVGLGARLNGKFFRKQRPALNRSLIENDRPVTCFMINQWRDKIGILWGDPRTTPGGKAKNYEFITRVEMIRDEWITEGEKKSAEKVGIAMKAHIIKNKSAAPERVAVMDFYFAPNEQRIPIASFDAVKAIIAVGRLYGIVDLRGNQYCYNDQQWTGIAKFARELREDLTLQREITKEVMYAVERKASGVIVVDSNNVTPPRRQLKRTAK